MGVGFGIDQLRVDANSVAEPLDAAFEHIATPSSRPTCLAPTGLSL